HGWAFVNIDDGWEAQRDAKGEILTNEKFPDMKALGDSLHKMGLKFGIYSSPGTLTCGGFMGSYKHEAQDAKTYAKWGIDYLKYDWCSYGQIAKDNSLPELKKPYITMQKALASIDRDIVYSLCQYGMGKVWEWGAEVNGNLWRTTGDITDTWESLSTIGFSQTENAPYVKPGNWNDPDMLIVGWVGWGPNLHPTRLTVNEQYTHISLWSLLSAPLLIGCDLTRLDDFTLNLLTNDEVIAINQDPLGKQATPKVKKDNIQVWVKDLEDGSKAVGIFNLGEKREKVSVLFSDLGLNQKQAVRDVWRQRDLGEQDKSFDANIGPHGVVLIKLTAK
ncbi:MAG TPA: glycoside hydrolase family 27 protein, partial [Bacteroidales bacterium]|nr:glycoside hydrolase family 27 protein [Bacteroidales bacterium]